MGHRPTGTGRRALAGLSTASSGSARKRDRQSLQQISDIQRPVAEHLSGVLQNGFGARSPQFAHEQVSGMPLAPSRTTQICNDPPAQALTTESR